MCGITGIFAYNLVGKFNKIHVTNATLALAKRGPDFHDVYLDDWVGLGHRRLSIIDTTGGGNQPMWDDSNRYCIVFNGEIFNYGGLKKELEAKGVTFQSTSDTEVLLKLFIYEGENCLAKLNGFFSFCIYDKHEQNFFIARDRYGIKPLLYLFDEDKFIFASEMKAVIQYGIDRQLDYNSIYTYLQLNYIPAPATIFNSVKKLMPGHYITVKRGAIDIKQYYKIPYNATQAQSNTIPYITAKEKLKTLLDASVQKRLVADVPLGAFLSGGIDSSVITALASKHKPGLHTFSIGYKDEKFFDETSYAKLVAEKFKTKHTVFSLTNDDLYAYSHAMLDYIDEPFADSSALAVYILSKETRKHATVALSGDGADELLAGYTKHAAANRVLHPGLTEKLAGTFGSLFKIFPQSRNSPLGNTLRQLSRFNEGLKLTAEDRYWRWASIASKDDALNLLHPDLRINKWLGEFVQRRKTILQTIPANETINDILYTDMQLVLPNDMLTKVDLMSMANGLEVRVPFLDFEVVNFIFSLPDHYKINRSMRKLILQDAFRDVLPPQLYNRPKKGFEIPLLKWLRREMRSLLDDLLSREFVEDQAIFHYPEIEKLKKQLLSNSPGDAPSRLWGLIVFQWWWKKTIVSSSSPQPTDDSPRI